MFSLVPLSLRPRGPDDFLRVACVLVALQAVWRHQEPSQGGTPRRVPIPLHICRSPLAAAETIPRLESTKVDRVNGAPLAKVDEDNRYYQIRLARIPGVASTGDSPTRVALVEFKSPGVQ